METPTTDTNPTRTRRQLNGWKQIADYMGDWSISTAQRRERQSGLPGPDEFLVFPRQCVATALGGQATVNEVRVDRAGKLFVLTGEGRRNKTDW